MTAKESKAVASVCLIGDPELYAHGEFASVQMQLFCGYEPKIGDKLVMQSALHAAEAELEELRRNMLELADEMKRGGDRYYAEVIQQLLASDGGADGDDTNEELK